MGVGEEVVFVGGMVVDSLVDELWERGSFGGHERLMVNYYVRWGRVMIVVDVNIVHMSSVPLLVVLVTMGLSSIHWIRLVVNFPAIWWFELWCS